MKTSIMILGLVPLILGAELKRGVPNYVLPKEAPKTHYEAVTLIKKWGNSDEFFTYLIKKRTKFSHTDMAAVEVIGAFRTCLDKGGDIHFVFLPMDKDIIGTWNGYVMKQNIKQLKLDVIERAGHIYHETVHKCGFYHLGDEPLQNDNENSFPYAAGYDFEDFLTAKIKRD